MWKLARRPETKGNDKQQWMKLEGVWFFFPGVLKSVLVPVLLNCIHHTIQDKIIICAGMTVAGNNKLRININKSKELKKKKAEVLRSFCWSLENDGTGEESGGDLD